MGRVILRDCKRNKKKRDACATTRRKAHVRRFSFVSPFSDEQLYSNRHQAS